MDPSQLPLRDIHLPETIGWWPPAMGWWILIFAIPLLIFLFFWLYKSLTRHTAIKTAKQLLQTIKQNNEASNEQKLTELSMLIRRTAISVFPRTDVAGLTGKAWLEFLDNSLDKPRFTEEAGTLLTNEVYRKEKQPIQVAPLITLCEDWLKALKKHQ